jgi:voltage-gated potassium channel
VEKKILEIRNGEDIRIRRRVFQLLDPVHTGQSKARAIEFALLTLIFFNIVAIVLESVESVNQKFGDYFRWLEVFSVLVFSVEYLLRVWVSVEDPRYKKRYRGRLRYMASTLAVINYSSRFAREKRADLPQRDVCIVLTGNCIDTHVLCRK